MAVRSGCPYDPGCETPCTADVGTYIGLTAAEDRRLLLAILEDLKGRWLGVEDFAVHVDALSWGPGLDTEPAAACAEAVSELSSVGLADYDPADGQFRYHGCPLVADIVETVTA